MASEVEPPCVLLAKTKGGFARRHDILLDFGYASEEPHYSKTRDTVSLAASVIVRRLAAFANRRDDLCSREITRRWRKANAQTLTSRELHGAPQGDTRGSDHPIGYTKAISALGGRPELRKRFKPQIATPEYADKAAPSKLPDDDLPDELFGAHPCTIAPCASFFLFRLSSRCRCLLVRARKPSSPWLGGTKGAGQLPERVLAKC